MASLIMGFLNFATKKNKHEIESLKKLNLFCFGTNGYEIRNLIKKTNIQLTVKSEKLLVLLGNSGVMVESPTNNLRLFLQNCN